MGAKLTRGNEFVFSKEHGFTGSCGGNVPVKGHMRGGRVHKEENRKDYREREPTRDRAEPEYPEVGTKGKPYGYRKGGFLKRAIKHPGALRRELHVPKGHKIPEHKLAKAAHAKGVLGKRARLAEELKHFHHHKAKGGHAKPDDYDREYERPKGFEYDRPRSELHEPHLSEPFEARRGGKVHHKAKGGHIKMLAKRHETDHHGEIREEYHRNHDHKGVAKRVDGHTTPHTFSKGGHMRMLARRHETEHHGELRREYHKNHDHKGRAAHKDGHTTPHPFAFGGRMPGAVAGAKHRARMGVNPMVSAVNPLSSMAPVPGLKRGGRR